MNYVSGASIIVLIIAFAAMNQRFVSLLNIKNLLTDISPLLAMSCGVTMVLLIGSIDLSIGSIVSCSVVLFTVLLQKIGYWSYPAVILFGVFAGLLNGFVYAKMKVPSFIVTLCAASIWQSAAYLLSGGIPLSMGPKILGFVRWGKINFSFLPLLFIISVVFILFYYIFQQRTVMGKTIYAVGANERAARIAGLNVDAAKMWAFTLSGVGSAVAGLLFAVKLMSGIPTLGESYTLLAIAAAVLGGNSLMGGKGSVFMALLGVSLVIVIQNGLDVVGVGVFWQQVIFGVLVLFAVYTNVARSGRDTINK
jgi:Ribose/xylose/arabinose/galactoside ABC-type transport systems, permease components